MAKLLSGKEVITTLHADLSARVEALKDACVFPMLAIIRIGERSDDIAYETSACKRCETLGVSVQRFQLPGNATQEELLKRIESINDDDSIHGCLLMRPLPKGFDEERLRNVLLPQKDIDGITDLSLSGVYANTQRGFPPCTAQACMEVLDHFNIPVAGKRAVVVGRSLVAGKPIAMLLLNRNATVTVCHSKTEDLPAICREADMLFVAAGRRDVVGSSCFSPKQTVIDVGIHLGSDGKLRGDVNMEDAASIVQAITPVPGGVGLVTTTVLVKHVVEAAERAAQDA